MKIKVCGMREPENIRDAGQLGIDMMGFIFYPGSARYVGDMPVVETTDVARVGVFVNADPGEIQELAVRWNLDFVQLHGDESPAYCREIAKTGLKIVKAFAVGDGFDFKQLAEYEGVVEYFLFDTKGVGYGGNGVSFDWELMKQYDFEVPFWLSGGIHPGLAGAIKELSIPQLYAVDINSGFEIEPGLKDIEKIKQFVNELQGR